MDDRVLSDPIAIRACDLPLDAWRLISRWLDPLSLQNFRLTCKAFAEAAAPHHLAVRLGDIAHLSRSACSAEHVGTVQDARLDVLPLLCKVRVSSPADRQLYDDACTCWSSTAFSGLAFLKEDDGRA